jgi:hypothetical protein
MIEGNLPKGKQFRKYIYSKEYNLWKLISIIFIILALFGWVSFFAIILFGEK